MFDVIEFAAALPWSAIIFLGTFGGLATALVWLACRARRTNRWTTTLAAASALGIGALTGLHLSDRAQLETLRRDVFTQAAKIRELETVLGEIQTRRDQLTAELELSQEGQRLGRLELERLLTRIERSVDAASASLEQVRSELVVSRRAEPLRDRAETGPSQRLEAILSEIDRLGAIRARPAVRLEPRKAEIDGDRAVIVAPAPTQR